MRITMDNLIDQNTKRRVDVDIEMAVLALCMRNEEAVMRSQNKLTIEDFTDDRNSIIYGVILEMFIDGVRIDRFTVIAELERRGLSEKVGGQRYVYRVGDTMAVMSGLDSYLDALKDRSDRVKIIKAVEKIKKQAMGNGATAPQVLDAAIAQLTQLRRDEESTGLVPMADVLKSSVTSIIEDIRHGDSGKLKLGFPKLDSMLGGLGPGTIHILAARPGMGKTALALNMAMNVAANQKTVVIFSLEMTNDELGKRLLSSAMSKPVRDIANSSTLSESDRNEMDQALAKLRDYPMYFYDRPNIEPGTMKGLIQQLMSTGRKPSLIFVDYIQLINAKGLPGRSRNDEVAAISRNFKLLAKELEIPIICLSQLSRESAKRTDHTPQISDLRDSGAIEQDADTIMFVDRPGYHPQKDNNTPDGQDHSQPAVDSNGNTIAEQAYIYLAKNRHGPVGKDPIWWIASKTLFFEYNEKDPKDPNIKFVKTVNGDAAAQQYDFEDKDEEPEMDPPLSEDDGAQQMSEDDGAQQDKSFMADAHDDYPEGFMD
jgi:replicative DNA helicase